jgi:hypothetical protein
MKFKKSFRGVPAGLGLIYPVEYTAGDTCPPDLIDAALEAGALDLSPPQVLTLGNVTDQQNLSGGRRDIAPLTDFATATQAASALESSGFPVAPWVAEAVRAEKLAELNNSQQVLDPNSPTAILDRTVLPSGGPDRAIIDPTVANGNGPSSTIVDTTVEPRLGDPRQMQSYLPGDLPIVDHLAKKDDEDAHDDDTVANTSLTVVELKAKLDAVNIGYKASATKAELLALLPAV